MLVNLKNNPLNHVAIIMDGNGRWAQARSHSRVWGHIRGVRTVSKIVEEADDCGVKALTMYAFSTENWSRPLTEVKTLFSLLKKFLQKEKERIIRNRIKFKIIGDLTALPSSTYELVKDLEEVTREHEGLKLTFAFSYGSRAEIISAFNSHIKEKPGEPISEEKLDCLLSNPESGDVDLLIRTGGDVRISNFLLWQCAYAEFYFSPVPWPDFSNREFRRILNEVSDRERRFGGVNLQTSLIQSAEIAKKNKTLLSESLRF